MKKLCQRFNWHFSLKSQPYLFDTTYKRNCWGTFIYAEVLRLGGQTNDMMRVLRHEAFRVDFTTGSKEFYLFWIDSLKWIILHSAEIADFRIQEILSWAVHMYTEAERRNSTFYLSSLTFNQILELTEEYNQLLLKPSNYNLKWKSKGWNWEYKSADALWCFKELTSGEQLYEEGHEMRHCVSTYSVACWNSAAAIFR